MLQRTALKWSNAVSLCVYIFHFFICSVTTFTWKHSHDLNSMKGLELTWRLEQSLLVRIYILVLDAQFELFTPFKNNKYF